MFLPTDLINHKIVKRLYGMSHSLLSRYNIGLARQSVASYHHSLFPEYRTNKALDNFLVGKKVVFVGSREKYEDLYSIINWHGRRAREFVGVEPRLDFLTDDDFELGARQIGQKRLFWVPIYIGYQDQTVSPEGCDMLQMAIADGEADCILSHYIIPYRVDDEEDLLDVFGEFIRVLGQGKQVRLYPVLEYDKDIFLRKHDRLSDFIRQNFDIRFESKRFVGMGPEKLTMILSKKPV